MGGLLIAEGVRVTGVGGGGEGSGMVIGESLGIFCGCRVAIENKADSVDDENEDSNVGVVDTAAADAAAAAAAAEKRGLAGRGAASVLSCRCTSSPFISPPCATAAAPLSK